MRPGPVPSGASGVGVRVASMRGSQVLATDIPAQDVVVDWTRDRVVPTQITFVAPLDWLPTDPMDPLANFGQRVHITSLVEVGGVVHEVAVGWFLVTAWSESDDVVQVTALDLMQLLEDDPMVWPSSPPSGATLRTELQRLAGDHLPVILDGVADVPVSSTLQWDTSRTTSIQDLCTSHGLEYGVKPDGYLHVWAARDGSAPVATFRASDLLVDAPRSSLDRRPNRWTVVGSVGDGDDATQVAVTLGTDVPPFEPSAYGVVRSRTELSGASSRAAVQDAARLAMVSAQIVSQTRSLQIVADPRLEGGDVIGVTTDAGETFVGRVVAYSLPLDDPAGQMRVDVEVLEW